MMTAVTNHPNGAEFCPACKVFAVAGGESQAADEPRDPVAGEAFARWRAQPNRHAFWDDQGREVLDVASTVVSETPIGGPLDPPGPAHEWGPIDYGHARWTEYGK